MNDTATLIAAIIIFGAMALFSITCWSLIVYTVAWSVGQTISWTFMFSMAVVIVALVTTENVYKNR